MPAFRRLSTKYAVAIAAVLLLGMALVLSLAGYFVYRGTNELRDELAASFSEIQSQYDQRSLRASSTYLSRRLFNPLYHLDMTALNAEIARINAWLEPRSVLILDEQGRVVTDGTLANARHGRIEPVPEELSDQPSLIEETEKGSRLYFRIAHDDEVIGYGRIEFFDARERALLKGMHGQVEAAWERFEDWFLSIGVIGLIVALLVSLVIGWRLSVSLSRPLRAMSDAAEQFASGNLSHQLPTQAEDELGRLAASLNRMAADLQKAGRVLHRAQEIAAFGSWEWRPGRETLQLSHGVYLILGLDSRTEPYRIDELVQAAIPQDRDQLAQVLQGAFETMVSFELRIRRRDGALRTVRIKGESEYEESGRLVASFGTIQDITEQQQAREQLMRLANFDTLTGLPNRNLFYDRLRHALQKTKRDGGQVALFFLDLDRFKEINDALGHDVGDALLRTAAQRLSETVRDCDTLARMGGDEFTLMIEGLSAAQSPSAVAFKLIDVLSAPFELAGRELFVSASVGIALFPQDADDLETLIKNADIAMYAAKEKGEGSFHFFTSELQRAASERLALEHQLRAALDQGELRLHFQPQVRVEDAMPVGVEALLRWGDGETSVSPARFVPVLESSGLITRVTQPVLRDAGAALAALKARGFLDLRVSVNLSARQLRQPELIGQIESTLTEFELRPEQLEIEITESTLLDNEQCQSNAAQLAALGVRLAIDDFGTGYSSLTYLKRFDVDALKVDRSFVQDMLVDQDDALIVHAVVGLASGLGIESVAEGVELAAQRAQLQTQGCDLIQGYLIARPMPLAELLDWLDAGQPAGGSASPDASAREAHSGSRV